MKSRLWRLGWKLAVVVVAVFGVLVLVAMTLLRGSLPQLEGNRAVAGLGSTVTIDRDALGVPTIRGSSRLDVARATGFIQAQDRFFQMDLMRRAAAGELSELFGAAALGMDRGVRIHRLRARAAAALERLSGDERSILQAYADGVNAGLHALRTRSFEYLLLRSEPRKWLPEDSILVGYAMFLDLQDSSGRRDRINDAVRQTLSPALTAYFLDDGTAWSGRLDGSFAPILPVPGAENFTYLATTAAFAPILGSEAEEFVPGSNNWAVARARTTRGESAIVANDMHLSLTDLPGTWYRIRFVVTGSGETAVDACGLNLPGTPFLVVGSNGHIAWGFTDASVDTTDLVIIEKDPGDPQRYRTPSGFRPFDHHEESIAVKGGKPDILSFDETVWGPALPPETNPSDPRVYSLAWIAHDEGRINFRIRELERARSVEEALMIAEHAWLPAQNIVVGDADGHIGWTVAGPVPDRHGYDGRFPVSMADGSRYWESADSESSHPRIVQPEDGALWTANAQVVGGSAADRLGDGGYAADGRAWQIGERLRERSKFDELQLFAIQCDNEVFYLRRWRDLLLDVLDEAAVAEHPGRAELRRLVEDWKGAATPESAGYTLLRHFRREVASHVLSRILAPCKRVYPDFSASWLRYEEPLWQLVRSQTPWTAAKEGWRNELLEAVDATVSLYTRDNATLAEQTWGKFNRVDMCHPFARILPWLRPWLGVPSTPLPGDAYVPNAFSGSHGPSERMVVSPGHEEAGIMEIPGGQCGHPLSPFFTAGHDNWVRRLPSHFLPGETTHTLTLEPSARE